MDGWMEILDRENTDTCVMRNYSIIFKSCVVLDVRIYNHKKF